MMRIINFMLIIIMMIRNATFMLITIMMIRIITFVLVAIMMMRIITFMLIYKDCNFYIDYRIIAFIVIIIMMIRIINFMLITIMMIRILTFMLVTIMMMWIITFYQQLFISKLFTIQWVDKQDSDIFNIKLFPSPNGNLFVRCLKMLNGSFFCSNLLLIFGTVLFHVSL